MIITLEFLDKYGVRNVSKKLTLGTGWTLFRCTWNNFWTGTSHGLSDADLESAWRVPYELQFDLSRDAGFDYAPRQLFASKIKPPRLPPSIYETDSTMDKMVTGDFESQIVTMEVLTALD
jgi:hypothetical protein